MYNPSQPNIYRCVRLEQERTRRREKRAREQQTAAAAALEEEQQRQQIRVHGSFFSDPGSTGDSTGDSPSLAASIAFSASDAEGNGSASIWMTSSMRVSSVGGFQDDGMGATLDAETLIKERVERSAAMGVGTAKAILQDEQEAQHKERVHQGKDMGSKMGRLLGKLTSSMGAGGGSPPPPGGRAAEEGAKGSTGVAHLVFVPSTLAAGGHMMKPATEQHAAAASKRPIRGKPSSTIVVSLSLATSNASIEDSALLADQLLGPWVCQAIQAECGSCGVVRSSKRWMLSTSTEEGVDATKVEPVRVFVRFDSVASAFKAAEKLDGKVFDEFCAANGLSMPAPQPSAEDGVAAVGKAPKLLCVSFYPTNLYDTGVFSTAVAAQ